ncbi:hypothetical protein BTA51_03205 [Hahella sp. CCB-MM4]|uniref:hypothetical protein n=1 Tax=Hahella sp. (strain CCB-MM4) TaxID=1926491 RepID=UPI000B9BADEC|nr:hypothetical protein [Hahella sp. CCB-MM4]OZG75399.1 hypothetical protein BTA51_03205 [Hahella sp. CCB-MM4]
MINYRFEEEKRIVLHYAGVLDDQRTLGIIETGSVNGPDEAEHLSRFFWEMVGLSINDSALEVPVCGLNEVDTWIEYIMDTFRSYLYIKGYGREWNRQTELA